MKKNALLLVLLVISLSAFGCAKISDSQSGSTTLDISDSSDNQAPHGPDGGNKVTDNGSKPGNDTDAGQVSLFNAANQEFSWDVFKKLNAEDSADNIFISPFSISSALTMALNGAEGTTRTEMEKMLYYGDMTRDELNRAYAGEVGRLSNLDQKVTLNNANSIWIRRGLEIKKEFVDLNRRYLEAEVQSLDFDDPSSVEVINRWVSEKTNRLIPSIISPPIPQEAVMYLINAIYFKGEWTTEFKAENTQEKDFFALDGKTDKVSMMQRTGKTDYFSDEELQAIRLPYGNQKVSMILVLPQKDLNLWIKSMNADTWKNILAGFRPVSDVQLQIPRFKMEYGLKELNGTLKDLGMKEALSDGADFSGITENVFISRVLHKAVVDVNEQGTEAAAVTSVEVVLTSAREPVAFIADRPFFFAIVDNEEGNLLFMGKKVAGDRD
jgi:serpin B